MPIDYHAPFEVGAYYHIYNRSINKECLFKTEGDQAFFLQRWNKYLAPYLKMFAYCLIGNHFHFLIQVREVDEHFLKYAKREQTVKGIRFLENKNVNTFLEDQFKRFFSSYAFRFNKIYQRTGSIFQKRFKRLKVLDDSHFTLLIHYIHHNPIHHHFTDDFAKWKYSSYKAICSHKPTKVEREAVLDWFDDGEDSRNAFIVYHQAMKVYKIINDLLIDGSE